MNRKQYLISIIALAIISIGLIISQAIFNYTNWFMIMLAPMLGYLYIKYRVDGGVQYFSTRFNMLLDYDLDTETALKMAQDGFDNAPTANLKTMYQMYIGLALYYKGSYEESIRSFNQVDLNKLNPVFHTLVFAFSAYAAFEIDDTETYNQSLDRLHSLKTRVPAKYATFVESYEEILEAIQNMDVSVDHYKEMIDKHFSGDNGFIARKLNYQYRLAYYYKAIGDTLEMDKCLAFVIANGKDQHLAIKAKTMFQNSVNIEDFIYDSAKKDDVVEEVKDDEEKISHDNLIE
jgi:tetratricopeptide (TPR) repeat protein